MRKELLHFVILNEEIVFLLNSGTPRILKKNNR